MISGRISSALNVSGRISAGVSIGGSLSGQAAIAGRISRAVTVSGAIAAAVTIAGTISVPPAVGADVYDGDMEFTPTQAQQTIHIKNKVALDNIIIQPIPSNYGLITWDGSTLMVS